TPILQEAKGENGPPLAQQDTLTQSGTQVAPGAAGKQAEHIAQAEPALWQNLAQGQRLAAVAVDNLRRAFIVQMGYAGLGHVGNLVALLAQSRRPGDVFQPGQVLVIGL